jgi:16S rRNA (cytosine967-C5)-methyltransferase
VEYDFVRRDWLDENLVFKLESHPPLRTMPSFQQGLFYVQDPSTLLAVGALDPRPGETVLDLCAAPGGKLTFIAQLMRNEGHLVGYDTVPERLKLIKENCERLAVTCVEPALSSSLLQAHSRRFDRVLIDAPCSNTGVMRRRVDLRWRIEPDEIARLRGMQLELLRQVVPLLKPNGILVYSTCSLEPEENENVVQQFLREHNQFQLEQQRELLPFVDEVDGAFVARFKRTH